MDPDEAAEWCKAQGGQLELSVVMDIPVGTWAEEQIRLAVAALAPDQRGFLADIKVNPETSHTYVLFEWRKGVPVCFQDVSIQLTDDVEVRLIQPSKPRGDSANIPASSPLAMIGPEFIAAIGDLVVKCQRAHPSYISFGYRKLEKFSGNLPTPAGEETFKEWVEQAMQALDEWDVSEAQKKQRITESLKGPASEAVRNLKLSKRDCTALDYLNILQEVFGRTEKAAELMYQYEHTYQKRGEKMTEYMRRLDKILYQVLLKKGTDPTTVDQVRMRQILKGALPLDPVMLQLRTREGNKELNYLELIRVVREEEALLEEKLGKRGEKVYAQPIEYNECSSDEEDPEETYEPEITQKSSNQVYGEIQKTLARVQEAQVKMEQTHTDLCRTILKVVEMQTEILKSLSDIRTAAVAVVSDRGFSNEPQEESVPSSSWGRCFACREFGHFKAQCPERRQGGSLYVPARPRRSSPWRSDPMSREENVCPQSPRMRTRVRVQQTGSTSPAAMKKFPDKLIGPSPIIPVQVEGVYTKALLDSGAQVTLIYRDFYQKYLKHIPLKKLKDLEIWGMGMEKFPYDGYIQVKLEFSSEIAGQPRVCDTLAIVCPRPSGANRSSMIVGMNADVLRHLLTPLVTEENPAPKKAHSMSRPACPRRVKEQRTTTEIRRLRRTEGTEKALCSGKTVQVPIGDKLSVPGLPISVRLLLFG
uniref:CCHC-type domain-containing protein n=1 Tax=Leptobrachium leishanense TaxID=445787 RepID=A0A8C5MGG5_9ANUR